LNLDGIVGAIELFGEDARMVRGSSEQAGDRTGALV